MRLKIGAVTGAFALAIAVSLPPSVARADNIRDGQWYLKSLDIAQAHVSSKGNGITVGIVDTGTSPHPDIRRNLLDGISFVRGDGGNGNVDPAGHGTAMTGLVAAHGRGSNGVLGIAPGSKVLPIKISNKSNEAPSTELAKGIDWAVKENVKVINVSAAVGPAFEVQDAVGAALDADIVVVAAVGNASSNAVMGYPAAIDGVLAVGAVGRDGKHSRVSLKDSRVQICAPGIDITTAAPGSKYAKIRGTSAATAIVSGAVALVRAKYPDLSAKDVLHRITATADDIGPPGRDDECGFGLLNVVKALTADLPAGGARTSAAATSAAATKPATLAPSSPTASGERAEPASSATPLVLGGLAGLVVAGGLVAALVIRRRRTY